MLLDDERKVITSSLETLLKLKDDIWQEGDDVWYEIYLPLKELLEKDQQKFTF